MSNIKFAHLGDIHLGYRQFNLVERQKDYYIAFKKAIDKIIAEKVDFVLISGDLYHHYSPQAGSIRKSIKILEKLQKANIPTIVIHGNHDTTERRSTMAGGNYLHLLQDFSLINYLDSENYEYRLNLGNFDIQILGVCYKSKIHIQEELDKVREKIDLSADYRILILHQAVEGQSIIPDELCEISVNQLKEFKDINYFALGHIHVYSKIGNLQAYYPGSLERWDFTDHDRKKGFLIKECSEKPPKFIEVESNRDMIEYKYTAEEESSLDVVENIISDLEKYDQPGNLIRVVIKGSLKEGEKKGLINSSKIKNSLKNALYIKVENKIETYKKVKSLIAPNFVSTTDAFMNYFVEQMKIDEKKARKYTSLAETLLSYLKSKDIESAKSYLGED